MSFVFISFFREIIIEISNGKLQNIRMWGLYCTFYQAVQYILFQPISRTILVRGIYNTVGRELGVLSEGCVPCPDTAGARHKTASEAVPSLLGTCE